VERDVGRVIAGLPSPIALASLGMGRVPPAHDFNFPSDFRTMQMYNTLFHNGAI